MEIVVIVIMLLVSFSLILKLTYLPAWGRVSICMISALFIGLSWESASGQSKTQISDWLQNPDLMLDMAVLLTVDVFIQIAFCILNTRKISGETLSKAGNYIHLITLYIPGILVFPALYALLVEVIFSFTGIDFNLLAWSLAFAIFVSGIVLTFAMQWIIPEKDLRLEMIFMINAMIALLGVVATVNGRTAVTGTNTVEWQALLGVVALLLIGATAGFFIFKRNNNKKLSHLK